MDLACLFRKLRDWQIDGTARPHKSEASHVGKVELEHERARDETGRGERMTGCRLLYGGENTHTVGPHKR